MTELNLSDCDLIHEDAVRRVAAAMPEPGLLEASSEFFRVLADPTRLRILCALEQEELCVCDLAVLLGMTKSAISHQLRLLRQARIVRHRRDGRVVYNSLDDEHIRQVYEMAVEHVSEVAR